MSKEHQQIQEINKSMASVTSLYVMWAKMHDLQFSEFKILFKLASQVGYTQMKLSQEIYIPKQTIHSIILGFIKRGWVDLSFDPSNSKEKVIVVTESGNKYLNDIFQPLLDLEAKVVKQMGSEMVEQLIHINLRYAEILKKEIENISGANH